MSLKKENVLIGFIGTGVMGKSMAKNLLQAGYTVAIHTRTKSKAQELIQLGAQWQETVADLAARAHVVITMVGYPEDVETVYLEESGIVNHAKPGTYLIDMTTSSPALAHKIYNKASEHQLYALDAPVSGGDIGARNGSLTIMVGGDLEAFDTVKPILDVMGDNIVLQGKAGDGQHTKMCNQITIASNMMGVCEAIAYAKKSGLDPKKVLQSIEKGAAGSWSLSHLAPKMLTGDFEPGFYVKHFIKDMRIALASAKEMGLMTPGLEVAKSMYDELAERGEADSGTQALYKLFV